MFGFLKKETPIQKLEKKYKALLEESFKLASVDRKASDAKAAEAEEVIKQIETLKN